MRSPKMVFDVLQVLEPVTRQNVFYVRGVGLWQSRAESAHAQAMDGSSPPESRQRAEPDESPCMSLTQQMP